MLICYLTRSENYSFFSRLGESCASPETWKDTLAFFVYIRTKRNKRFCSRCFCLLSQDLSLLGFLLATHSLDTHTRINTTSRHHVCKRYILTLEKQTQVARLLLFSIHKLAFVGCWPAVLYLLRLRARADVCSREFRRTG